MVMKKMLIGAALIIGTLGLTQRTEAQVRVGVNINIGDQPTWRAPGYDYVQYYYLPDIETYYYVPTRQFIYLSNGRWTFSYNLPRWHRYYDLHSGYKVVVNRPNAYRYYDQHRVQYKKNKHHNNNNRGKKRGWRNH
jgi:hypothetical protein